MAGYAGESVALRYDPRDITTVLVYGTEGDREVFLARAYAQDLETEQLSLDEAKASSRKVREAGKAVTNRSILTQVRDRETFLTQKKTKKERQKAQQGEIRKAKQPVSMEPEPEEVVSNNSEAEPEMPSVGSLKRCRGAMAFRPASYGTNYACCRSVPTAGRGLRFRRCGWMVGVRGVFCPLKI